MIAGLKVGFKYKSNVEYDKCAIPQHQTGKYIDQFKLREIYRAKHLNLFEMILSRMVKNNENPGNILQYICKKGSIRFVFAYLKYFPPDRESFILVCKTNKIKLVTKMAEIKPSLLTTNTINIACEKGYTDLFNTLIDLKCPFDELSLHIACVYHNDDILIKLIENNCSIGVNQTNIICCRCNIDIIQKIFDSNCIINFNTFFCYCWHIPKNKVLQKYNNGDLEICYLSDNNDNLIILEDIISTLSDENYDYDIRNLLIFITYTDIQIELTNIILNHITNVDSNFIYHLIKTNNVEIFTLVKDRINEDDKREIMLYACKYDNDLLIIMINDNWDMDGGTMVAWKNNNSKLLDILLENNCSYDYINMRDYAKNKNLNKIVIIRFSESMKIRDISSTIGLYDSIIKRDGYYYSSNFALKHPYLKGTYCENLREVDSILDKYVMDDDYVFKNVCIRGEIPRLNRIIALIKNNHFHLLITDKVINKAFYYSIIDNNTEVFRILLHSELCDPSFIFLLKACEVGNECMIRELMYAGCELSRSFNQQTITIFNVEASKPDNTNILKILLKCNKKISDNINILEMFDRDHEIRVNSFNRDFYLIHMSNIPLFEKYLGKKYWPT